MSDLDLSDVNETFEHIQAQEVQIAQLERDLAIAQAKLITANQELNRKHDEIAGLEHKVKKLEALREIASMNCDHANRRVKELEEALTPFAHEDMCEPLAGMNRIDSPIFQRNKAIIRLGDCMRARATLLKNK